MRSLETDPANRSSESIGQLFPLRRGAATYARRRPPLMDDASSDGELVEQVNRDGLLCLLVLRFLSVFCSRIFD